MLPPGQGRSVGMNCGLILCPACAGPPRPTEDPAGPAFANSARMGRMTPKHNHQDGALGWGGWAAGTEGGHPQPWERGRAGTLHERPGPSLQDKPVQARQGGRRGKNGGMRAFQWGTAQEKRGWQRGGEGASGVELSLGRGHREEKRG